MIDERTEEVAALYALDLLEGGEKAAFEATLRQDSRLRSLVDELRQSSAAMVAVAQAAVPSAALRARVLAIPGRSAASSAPAQAAPETNVLPFRLPAWTAWAAAAGFAVAAGWFAQLYIATEAELVAAREGAAVARVESESTRQLLEAERLLALRQIADLRSADARIAQLQQQADLASFKISSLASLLGESSGAQAIAVWSPAAQQGVLTVEKLPALAADKDYQLWVVDPQYPIPVDGGVFTVDPASGTARLEFRPKQPVAQVAKFAISLERKGGVPKAEGPMVLLSP
jgi:anti-sigma-K factor RskA